MRQWKPFVDLTVTSPPYDNLRDYQGYEFNAKNMLQAIYDVTVVGGVCVWVVGDKIREGNRSLTSFKHALIARDIGWNIHDVMIYQKRNTPFMRSNAYTNCYEFMLILSNRKPKTFNPITEATVRKGWETAVFNKGSDGVNKKRPVKLQGFKTKTNIWTYAVGKGGTTSDTIAFQHPAVFPEKLAEDHIVSWSNSGDFVLDPMCGSGTTCKMAARHSRNWLGIDISSDYIKISKQRLAMELL